MVSSPTSGPSPTGPPATLPPTPPPTVKPPGHSSTNLALNTTGANYPNVSASDSGWGGGANKADINDGRNSYDTWARGLAFTGGGVANTSCSGPYLEPAGVRQVIIDFGRSVTIGRLVMWHHGRYHTPATDNVSVSTWNTVAATWEPVAGLSRHYGAVTENGTNSGMATSDEYDFESRATSKVRYAFDNAKRDVDGATMCHGWIYEAAAYAY